MTSGVLARRAGVNKETVRYYERERLLPSPPRTGGGYRTFSDEDLKRLVFIKNAQKFGFGLQEIRELLAIADGELIDRAEVRAVAKNKVAQIDEQIVRLARLRHAMQNLIHRCARHTELTGCPIIDTLADGAIDSPDTVGDR